jgi:hypothetical protein
MKNMLRSDPNTLGRFNIFFDQEFMPKMSKFFSEAPLHVHALDATRFGVEGGGFKDRILAELENNGLRNRTENHVKVISCTKNNYNKICQINNYI